MSVPPGTLDGKVALVTGGSRGLGRAIARGLAAAGADVVAASRSASACQEVADEIRALGRRAAAVGCHVGDWAQCADLVRTTVGEFGRLDILVNNAGIAPVPPSLGGVTEALFDKTLAVNLKGPLRLTGLAAEHLPPGGSVINISSLASLRPAPYTVVYAAAKAGLNALTRAAAQELGPRGIRVNAIVCGMFHTDTFDRSLRTPGIEEQLTAQIPLGRIGSAEDVAGTAVFLASEASAYMTGALVCLDGGAG
jgi:NAD(P)-dependent dehydrogenase (short-subunit alcohol dehydrogenase family)